MIINTTVIIAMIINMAIIITMNTNTSKETYVVCHDVICHLEIEKKKSKIFAVLEFTNNSQYDVKLLKSHILLEKELTTNAVFFITRDNVEIPFTGRTIKRASTESDYYLLKKGQKLTTSIEISKYYDFSKPGKYVIFYRYVDFLKDLFSDKNVIVCLKIVSNKKEFIISPEKN